MAVSSVSGASPTSAPSKSSLNIQDFLRILTSQLNNQDPLKPMDNQEFVAQLAQFTSLQQTQQLNEKLDSLLSIQAANQSVGLLGRSVDVQTSSGKVTGTVTALDFSSGSPQLSVRQGSGQLVTVALSGLLQVR
jgi:flagellar basal-body rod modification protein FlgD